MRAAINLWIGGAVVVLWGARAELTTTMRLLTALLLGVSLASPAVFADEPAADPFYGSRICLAPDAPKEMYETAEELATWLGKATGVAFTTGAPPAESGIFLLAVGSPFAPQAASKLQPLASREAFLLMSEGQRLYIVSKTPRGVRNGVYFYLEQLGFRWFWPTENGTIVPTLERVSLDIDRVVAPAFRMRQMAGTGGFGGSLVLDPDRTKQARWTKWLQRIRLDGEAAISGHAGEAFNVAHRQELAEHPEYLAEIDGKRQPWAEITKPCYSNPGLIDLYVRDRAEAMRKMMTHAPNAPRSFAVSVEPSDGGGHCECAECCKIGTVSDRVFSLANAVARVVAKEFPGRRVSLLAYNKHAAVPGIALEPNVYVVATPYGFNRTGLSPEEYLAAWGEKKASDLGLYDYWAIPDWSHGLPDVSFEEMAAKVRLWHADHVDGAALESDYGAGAIGVVWYLASRLFWDPETDIHAVLDDYYSKAFGEARVPMERMIGRWGGGYHLTEGELGQSYRDIQEARALAGDPAVVARVNDFALYLHYLRLWYEFQFIAPEPEEFKPPLRAMIKYLWRIYPTDMTHTYRLTMLLLYRATPTGGVVDEDMKKEWGFYDKSAPGWQDITPVTLAEIDALMSEGARRYPVIHGVEPKRFSSTLVPLAPTGAALDAEIVETQPSGYPADYEFYVPNGVTNVAMSLKRGSHPGPNQRVTVKDRKGSVIFRREIMPAAEWQELSIPIPAAGYYKMNVFDQKQMFRLRIPARLPFVITGGFMSASQSPLMYFFVPRGTKRVAFICNSVTPVVVLGPDGQDLPTTGKRLIYVNVPSGQDGQVWAMRNIKTWEVVQMVNVPNVWSFSRSGLMVPEDVAPGRLP